MQGWRGLVSTGCFSAVHKLQSNVASPRPPPPGLRKSPCPFLCSLSSSPSSQGPSTSSESHFFPSQALPCDAVLCLDLVHSLVVGGNLEMLAPFRLRRDPRERLICGPGLLRMSSHQLVLLWEGSMERLRLWERASWKTAEVTQSESILFSPPNSKRVSVGANSDRRREPGVALEPN